MPDERGGLVLELTRTLSGTPERVFQLLTEPAELARWWGPRGFTTPEVDLDLRVGGRYRFTMQPPDGEAFHLSGEFIAVDPVHRLHYTFRWDEPLPDDRETVVRLSLAREGERTQLSLWQGSFATEERVALHADGWADSLERLEGELIESGP